MLNICRNVTKLLLLLSLPMVGQADLVWSIDLDDPPGAVGPSRTLVITGTLTNSSSSTEILGVIGGTAGIPPGFDYEVGGFAFVSSPYLFDWAPDGAESFITQFEGVNLAPGASFDFDFARLSPNGVVTPGATYTSSLQLQLFDAPRPGPMIGSSSDSFSWTVVNEQMVSIDIKPGKDPNNIKPSSRQKFVVAILTGGSFNALDVDFTTVAFGPRAANASRGRAQVRDVDKDGDMDLLLRFDTQDTGIACGDTEATLTGETFSGSAIVGTDAIVTVNCPFVDGETVTVLIGDKDCFGLGGVCSDGDRYLEDLGGVHFADNRDPGEPLGVDQWGTKVMLVGPSFDIGLDLGGATPSSASFTIFLAGLEHGATFSFNGSEIGTYAGIPINQVNPAITLTFDVPISLLSNTNILTMDVPDVGLVQDGFIIDYLELTVETATAGP